MKYLLICLFLSLTGAFISETPIKHHFEIAIIFLMLAFFAFAAAINEIFTEKTLVEEWANNWLDNPGYMPVPEGELIDVYYRSGHINYGIKAGITGVERQGTIPHLTATSWNPDLPDSIIKWRKARV